MIPALLAVTARQGWSGEESRLLVFFRELVGGIPWVILYSLKGKGAQDNWQVFKDRFAQA